MKFFAYAALPFMLLAGCTEEAGTNGSAAAPVAGAAAPAGAAWVDTVSKTSDGGYVMGNPNAAIKLVEYGSRTCHICAEFEEKALEPLKAKYIASGKVSYEFRDFLRNGLDVAQALLGQCGGTGPYFALLDQQMRAQAPLLDRAGKLPPEFLTRLSTLPPAQQTVAFAEELDLIAFVQQRGIPEARARACLADGAAADALAKSTSSAVETYKVQGTPTFLINGRVVEATTTWEQLETKLREAGA